ncbi:MAG: endo-1,4-beta-xylanase [Rhodothermaceae bacterium]|nr:endo-1,4-beta-xylanase [Rhodothermaceae bacterium]
MPLLASAIRLFGFLVLILVVFSCDSSAQESDPEPDPDQLTIQDVPGLKTVAPYPIGVAMQSSRLGSAAHGSVMDHTFNSLTAEWEMKMNPIFSGPNSYNWTGADALVNYAELNGMQVHGHALVWHNATPTWLENFSGDDEAFEQLIEDYITDVVTRYKGRVISWDVVNEVFEDNTGRLRDSVFRTRMGDDFVARLFEYARAADPDALLFYNDYGTIWDRPKRAAMFAMIDDLIVRGIPIDGVGLQVHITYEFPSISEIETTMQGIVERGLKLHLSELDIRVNPQGDLTELTPIRSEAQKERVKALVQAFNALPEENRFAITTWGLRDPESWLIDFWGNPEWPLLFDASFHPKPAYVGFLEALQESQ